MFVFIYTADLHIRAGAVSLKYRTRKFHKQVQRNAVTCSEVGVMVPAVGVGDILAEAANIMLPALVMCPLYSPVIGNLALFSIHIASQRLSSYGPSKCACSTKRSLPVITVPIERHYRQAFVHMICCACSMAAVDTCGNHTTLSVKGGEVCHAKVK